MSRKKRQKRSKERVRPPIINFNQWWDKLVDRQIGDSLHTVRWNDKKPWYDRNIDREMEIRVKHQPAYRVIIDDTRLEMLCNLSIRFIRADTYDFYTARKFFDEMANFYVSKPDWKGWKSTILIIYMSVAERLY